MLTDLVSDPNVIARQNEWRAYIKEQASLTTLVNAFNRYEKTLQERDQSKQALMGQIDPDYKEMLELEVDELEEQIEKIEDEIKVLLLPKDPKDEIGRAHV